MKKKIAVLILFLFCTIAFAKVNLSDAVIKQIDVAFESQSREQVSAILNKYSGTPEYANVEAYIMQKTREALIFNNLNFAKVASLELINKNLDNFDAVDLYSLINKAIVRQRQIEKTQEEARIAKEAEEKAQAEEVKDKIDKDYNSIKNADSGTVVYLTQPNKSRYSPLSWNADLHIAALGVITTPTIDNYKYGIGFSTEFYYYSDSVTVGANIDVESLILTFSGGESLINKISFVPSLALNSISDRIFLRCGGLYRTSDSEVDGTAVSTFFSPVLGVGLLNAQWGKNQFNLTADYLAGGLAIDEVNAAFDFSGKIFIPIAEVGQFNIGLNTGISDTLMFVEDGIENQAELVFSIGVGTYE
jgi:hypothetical protein